jgi:hypothetical protein
MARRLGAEKWYQIRDQALHPDQPFVFANGNREAYGALAPLPPRTSAQEAQACMATSSWSVASLPELGGNLRERAQGWDANMLQTAFNQGANSAAGSIDANGGGVLKVRCIFALSLKVLMAQGIAQRGFRQVQEDVSAHGDNQRPSA